MILPMDIIYVDILTLKFVVNLGSNMDLIYWPVRLFSKREEDGVKGVDGVNIDSLEYHFIRVHENLVQHPSIINRLFYNKKSIPYILLAKLLYKFLDVQKALLLFSILYCNSLAVTPLLASR